MKPYAVVQLRQDNKLGTLFNMVGFQTKLKHGEQARIFRTIPGLAERRVRAARRPAPQHLPQFAEAARRDAAAEGRCRGCASPARSPAARAMSNPPRSGCSPAASPPPSGCGETLAPPPPTTAHRRAARATSPAAISRPIDAGPSLVPADERQFRPVPAARRRPPRREGRKFGRGSAKNLAKQERAQRARARRSRALDRRRAPAAAAE